MHIYLTSDRLQTLAVSQTRAHPHIHKTSLSDQDTDWKLVKKHNEKARKKKGTKEIPGRKEAALANTLLLQLNVL